SAAPAALTTGCGSAGPPRAAPGNPARAWPGPPAPAAPPARCRGAGPARPAAPPAGATPYPDPGRRRLTSPYPRCSRRLEAGLSQRRATVLGEHIRHERLRRRRVRRLGEYHDGIVVDGAGRL